MSQVPASEEMGLGFDLRQGMPETLDLTTTLHSPSQGLLSHAFEEQQEEMRSTGTPGGRMGPVWAALP